jgi:hypothetical protein
MKDINELYVVIDTEVVERRAKGFRDNCTLDRLFPDEETMHRALEGFSNEQILQAVVEKGLRSGYCVWCESRIRPNGQWISLPETYAKMIQEKKYIPHNQGICNVCEDEQIKKDDETTSF